MAPGSGSSSIAPAIISAAAALSGVCVSQLITTFQRYRDDKRSHRAEVARALAPTLSLAMDAMQLIDRGRASDTTWGRQESWLTLRDERWPSIREGLLVQAAQEHGATEPTWISLAQELQLLLLAEEKNPDAALAAWKRAIEHAQHLQTAR